jgi:hypothetical protein
MDRVETPEDLAGTPTIHRHFQRFERASIKIGKLVGAGDSRVSGDSNGRISLL